MTIVDEKVVAYAAIITMAHMSKNTHLPKANASVSPKLSCSTRHPNIEFCVSRLCTALLHSACSTKSGHHLFEHIFARMKLPANYAILQRMLECGRHFPYVLLDGIGGIDVVVVQWSQVVNQIGLADLQCSHHSIEPVNQIRYTCAQNFISNHLLFGCRLVRMAPGQHVEDPSEIEYIFLRTYGDSGKRNLPHGRYSPVLWSHFVYTCMMIRAQVPMARNSTISHHARCCSASIEHAEYMILHPIYSWYVRTRNRLPCLISLRTSTS